jgi:hypothetical protein
MAHRLLPPARRHEAQLCGPRVGHGNWQIVPRYRLSGRRGLSSCGAHDGDEARGAMEDADERELIGLLATAVIAKVAFKIGRPEGAEINEGGSGTLGGAIALRASADRRACRQCTAACPRKRRRHRQPTATPLWSRSPTSASKGRHRKQSRYPTASAAAAEGKNSLKPLTSSSVALQGGRRAPKS